jgi:uncharacterized membrane protein
MFAAIIFFLAFTPIGYIQLPFIKATIVHIPVIIGSVMLGAQYGAALGFWFGATSLISNSLTPTVSSFAFTPFMPLPGLEHGSLLSVLVCFVPRILVGVVPWLVYMGMKKLLGNRKEILPLTFAGIIGSLTNTLLVMHLIYFLFRDSYASVRNVGSNAVYSVIVGVIAANGIPEAIIAGACTAAICGALRKAESLKTTNESLTKSDG